MESINEHEATLFNIHVHPNTRINNESTATFSFSDAHIPDIILTDLPNGTLQSAALVYGENSAAKLKIQGKLVYPTEHKNTFICLEIV